jgi:hypothetical protein
VLALLLFVGCLPSSEVFPEKYARLACLRMRECALGEFEATYDDDLAECEDAMLDWLEPRDACEFDREAARDCLESLRNDTCGDLDDGADGCGAVLEEVYRCDLYDLMD